MARHGPERRESDGWYKCPGRGSAGGGARNRHHGLGDRTQLVAAGLRTTVWDRSASVTALLSDASAVAAGSAAEAVADAGGVITLLPTPQAVQAVMFDREVASRSPRARRGPGAHHLPHGHDAGCRPGRPD